MLLLDLNNFDTNEYDYLEIPRISFGNSVY